MAGRGGGGGGGGKTGTMMPLKEIVAVCIT